MKHCIKTIFILWATFFGLVPMCFCCAVEASETDHHHHANEQIVSELCFNNDADCLQPLSSCGYQDKEHPCCIHTEILTNINFQLENNAQKPTFGTLNNNKLHLLAPKYSKVYSVNPIPHYQKERTLAELCRFLI